MKLVVVSESGTNDESQRLFYVYLPITTLKIKTDTTFYKTSMVYDVLYFTHTCLLSTLFPLNQTIVKFTF